MEVVEVLGVFMEVYLFFVGGYRKLVNHHNLQGYPKQLGKFVLLFSAMMRLPLLEL